MLYPLSHLLDSLLCCFLTTSIYKVTAQALAPLVPRATPSISISLGLCDSHTSIWATVDIRTLLNAGAHM